MTMIIHKLLNLIRNLLNFHVRHPWVEYGTNVHCQWSTKIYSPNKKVKIGSHVGIGNRCLILTDVTIGSYVLIASHVALLAKDAHTYDQIGVTIFDSPRGDKYNIIIEDDVWIGHGAIILSGVIIGRGAIVAAGALVTKDVAPYTIVGVKPAVEIGQRFTKEEIMQHERLLCSERSKYNHV